MSASEGSAQQKPLELILARSFLSNLSTPMFLLEPDGTLVFYNDAAGQLVGRRFEETGALSLHDWTRDFGPLDEHDQPIPYAQLEITHSIIRGRPGHGRFRVRTGESSVTEVEVSALPIVGPGGLHGGLVIFWPHESGSEA